MPPDRDGAVGLPDFLISIPEPASQVRARDLPTGAFFAGFPDDLPLTDCFEAAEWERQHAIVVNLERWVSLMLTRAIVEPVLTLEVVQRLGPSRDVLARAYLETIGWVPPSPDSPDMPPVVEAPARRKRYPPLELTWRTATPGKNLHGILKQLATRTRRLPTELWALPISAWLFTLKCFSDPKDPVGLPDDDLMRLIGMEV